MTARSSTVPTPASTASRKPSTSAPAFDLSSLSEQQVRHLPNSKFRALAQQILSLQRADRKENQLLYYKPVSDQAERIHQSKCRYVAAAGGNGCLPLHAPVLMADGSWLPLDAVSVGDYVMAADPVTGETAPARVTTTWRSGWQPVYRITFSDGGSFEATAEHQVPLYLGSGRKTSKGKQKRPHKRRLGDYIEPILRRGASNPSKRISAVSPVDFRSAGKCSIKLPPYLLGALLGDGGFTAGVKFHNADADVVARVQAHVESLGGRLSTYGPIEFGVLSGVVRDEIRRLGLWGANSHHKFIPEEAFRWSRDERMQLLAGLVDTDGTVDWFTSCCPVLSTGVARLVQSLGGKATVHHRVVKCQNGFVGEAWGVYMRLNERIPLTLSRKQAVNQRGKEIDYRRRICRKAELIGTFECGDIEVDHPAHCYITGDYVIVGNSSKTETCLVHLCAMATGIIPPSVSYLADEFRGPVNIRVVVESLTTVLHPIILPKLKWWVWTGVGTVGSEQGHYGWIPKTCLIDGSWDRSWSEKLRMLRILCRDVNNPDKVVGESTMTFMSHDQDPSDFASGDFQYVLHDEPPSHAIWTENEARTMRVDGRMFLAMTWPDDPAIPVDWIFDDLYEKGRQGPNKSPNHDWFELYTTDNPHLNQSAIANQMSEWSDELVSVRIYGRPIRFSNRMHPLFTDTEQHWCFNCKKPILPREDKCEACGGLDVTEYNHVAEFPYESSWPVIWLLDPHPRKPHMYLWVMIDPSDDIWVVADGECEGDPAQVHEEVICLEESMGLNIAQRIMDPNMGRSPASSKRNITWQDEFSDAGLQCDLADDSDVGRGRINEYLKPDQYRMQPRLHVHARCERTIFQTKRYTWDENRAKLEKDLKQKPRPKYDDFPTLLKYLMNSEPSFSWLREGAPIIRGRGKRKRGY